MQKEASDKTGRALGRFRRETDAARFIEELYRAGACEVIVPDIYDNKAGDQFADCLLVRLPQDGAKRATIRQVCAQLRKKRLGAVEPDADFGEAYLYLLMA